MHIEKLYSIYLQHPSVQTDTRKLKEGDIYFALKGPNFDGNTFTAQALNEGAAYAIIDNAAYAIDERTLVVDDVLETLQALARYHRQQFHIPFLAITGSNGKTTTKELIAAALGKKYNVYATVGNLNNHIGVPLTLLSIKKDAGIAIIEMGANHQREIASYCQIALPTHGLITNCGKAHIEGFGGIEGVRKGKGELYDFLRGNKGVIFRNTDLDYLEGMAHDIAKQITYGSANAQYVGRPVMENVFLNVAVLSTHAEALIHSSLVGDYNFPNVMAAVAVGLHFNVPIDDIRDAIESYNPDNSRSQWMQKGTNRIILDAYNANPTSMKAAIINFANTAVENKVLWIGGMKEMGAEEYAEHKELVALIDGYQWNDVILVGKEFEAVKNNYKWFATAADAAEYVKEHPPVNNSILIKGSNSSRMSVLLQALPG